MNIHGYKLKLEKIKKLLKIELSLNKKKFKKIANLTQKKIKLKKIIKNLKSK